MAYEVTIVDGLPHPKSNDVGELPDVSYGSTTTHITGCSFENCNFNLLTGPCVVCESGDGMSGRFFENGNALPPTVIFKQAQTESRTENRD